MKNIIKACKIKSERRTLSHIVLGQYRRPICDMHWGKYAVICLLILGMCTVTACAKSDTKEQSEDTGYKIYYIDKEETEIVSEPYKPKNSGTDELIAEFLVQLKKSPKDIAYKKAKPDTVSFRSYVLKGDQLTLDFDSNYLNLKGVSEILCRAAIVKTLCQIDGVNYVEFNVNGQPLMNNNEKPIGFMKKDDFIDNMGSETNYSNADMTLYFANEKGDGLIETHVKKSNYDGTIPMEQVVIEQLIKGPDFIEGAEEEGIYATVPSDTKLLKATTKDGVCYVDFSDKFLNKLPEITDEVAVYSVVNSLVELSAVNKVKFLINGQEQKIYWEKISFDGFFERNLDIVKNNQ